MNTQPQTKKWTVPRTGYIYKFQCKAQNGKPLGLGCVEASWDKFIYIGSTVDTRKGDVIDISAYAPVQLKEAITIWSTS